MVEAVGGEGDVGWVRGGREGRVDGVGVVGGGKGVVKGDMGVVGGEWCSR